MLADWWQRWRLPALGLGAVAIGIGAQIDWLLKSEAIAALCLAPVVAVALSLKDIDGRLRSLSLLVAAVVVVMTAMEVTYAAFPSAPIASATLSANAPKTTLRMPPAMTSFELDTTATLASGGGQARGRVALVLERDGSRRRAAPAFSHSASRQRVGRRTMRSGGMKVQQVARERVSLSGDGALDITLASTSGAVLPTVEVAIRAVPLWSRVLPFIMALAAFAALVIQVVAARRDVKTFVAAGIGVGALLGPYVQHHFNPYSVGSAAVGALVVAIGIGGGAGTVACLVIDKFAHQAS